MHIIKTNIGEDFVININIRFKQILKLLAKHKLAKFLLLKLQIIITYNCYLCNNHIYICKFKNKAAYFFSNSKIYLKEKQTYSLSTILV